MNEDVIVSMTSWKGRISGVSKAIYSLLVNTHKPRSIELNLSEEEFTNKENDLPEDLLLLKENGYVNINWVGKNTKSFKKILPTIKKYYDEKDLLIMSADDDIIYPNDIIEKFVSLLKKNPNSFITFGTRHGTFKTQSCVNGGATLYKVDYFNDIFFNIPEEVINTNEDDWWYSYCFWKNGGINPVYSGINLKFFNQTTKHNYNTFKTKKLLLNLKLS